MSDPENFNIKDSENGDQLLNVKNTTISNIFHDKKKTIASKRLRVSDEGTSVSSDEEVMLKKKVRTNSDEEFKCKKKLSAESKTKREAARSVREKKVTELESNSESESDEDALSCNNSISKSASMADSSSLKEQSTNMDDKKTSKSISNSLINARKRKTVNKDEDSSSAYNSGSEENVILPISEKKDKECYKRKNNLSDSESDKDPAGLETHKLSLLSKKSGESDCDVENEGEPFIVEEKQSNLCSSYHKNSNFKGSDSETDSSVSNTKKKQKKQNLQSKRNTEKCFSDSDSNSDEETLAGKGKMTKVTSKIPNPSKSFLNRDSELHDVPLTKGVTSESEDETSVREKDTSGSDVPVNDMKTVSPSKADLSTQQSSSDDDTSLIETKLSSSKLIRTEHKESKNEGILSSSAEENSSDESSIKIKNSKTSFQKGVKSGPSRKKYSKSDTKLSPKAKSFISENNKSCESKNQHKVSTSHISNEESSSGDSDVPLTRKVVSKAGKTPVKKEEKNLKLVNSKSRERKDKVNIKKELLSDSEEGGTDNSDVPLKTKGAVKKLTRIPAKKESHSKGSGKEDRIKKIHSKKDVQSDSEEEGGTDDSDVPLKTKGAVKKLTRKPAKKESHSEGSGTEDRIKKIHSKKEVRSDSEGGGTDDSDVPLKTKGSVKKLTRKPAKKESDSEGSETEDRIKKIHSKKEVQSDSEEEGGTDDSDVPLKTKGAVKKLTRKPAKKESDSEGSETEDRIKKIHSKKEVRRDSEKEGTENKMELNMSDSDESERESKKQIAKTELSSSGSDSEREAGNKSHLKSKSLKSTETKKQEISSSGNSSGSNSDNEARTTKQKKVVDKWEVRINNYKKYLRAAGIRINNYAKVWKGCKTGKQRADKLHQMLEDHGLEGRPSMSKCKKIRKKMEKKREVEELDLCNIIDDNESHYSSRSTRRSMGQKKTRQMKIEDEEDAAAKAAAEIKQRFSRIKDLIESDSCSD